MKKLFYTLIVMALFSGAVHAQSDVSGPTVMQPVYFDVSPPLRDMVKNAGTKVDMTWKDGVVKNNHYPERIHPPYQDEVKTTGIMQTWNGTTVADTTFQNFDGVGANNGVCPPDTDGEVGMNHFFSVVNLQYAIYNKSGVKLLGPSNNSTIFSGMPHNSNDGDAIVLYDEVADRWLFSQFSLPTFPNGPFYENVAISQTADPTGSWYRYQYQFTDMPDYPKLSVWPDGYYMTTNRFSSGSTNYMGTGAVAMDRTKMLAGDPTAEMVFFTLSASNEAYAVLPSDCDGEFPPMGTPAYFAYLNDGPDRIGIYEFHVDWTTTTNSTYTLQGYLPVTAFNGNLSNGIPQKGTSVKLDAIAGRIMFRLPFRKFSDHWSMVAMGTVNVGSGQAGIRWFELRTPGTGPWTLYQEGTYSPDANYRWMGSIAMDSSGNIAMGYSVSSADMFPSIRYTGRMNGDPLGEMTIAEAGIMNGGGYQSNTWSGSPSRWGDYSCMSVDPAQPATFWYTQEYYSAPSQASWKTRVGAFSFGNILSVDATATPPLVCTGGTTQLNVNAVGGSGTYTYEWTSVPAGFTSSIQNPMATPTETTKYIGTANDGTTSKGDTVVVTVIPLPTVDAGEDAVYCWYVPAFPVTGTVSDASHVTWTTSGDGHFLIDTIAAALYYSGQEDRTNGSVTLTLTGDPVMPCTQSVSDAVVITFDPCTGIADPDHNGLGMTINPNPSHDFFTLELTGVKNQKVQITLTDMKGITVWSEQVKAETGTVQRKVDVSAFSKGTYVLRVTTSLGTKTEKVVVR
jgi:hypothetical protein